MAIDFEKATAALENKPMAPQGQMPNVQPPINPTMPVTPQYPIPWSEKKILLDKLCKDLKDERNRQGINQRELARRSGYSQGTITRAETRGWISINALLAITAALGKEITIK